VAVLRRLICSVPWRASSLADEKWAAFGTPVVSLRRCVQTNVFLVCRCWVGVLGRVKRPYMHRTADATPRFLHLSGRLESYQRRQVSRPPGWYIISGSSLIRSGNATCLTGLTALKQCTYDLVKQKGKIHPLTGHEGSEGEYRYSSTLSLTSALNGGGWLTSRPGRFTPGKETRH
jgi:hypothetical protein